MLIRSAGAARSLALGLGQRLEARDAVLDPAVAFLVGAVELYTVVEGDAAHLVCGLALALAVGLGVEEAGAVVDAGAAVGELLAALGDLHVGQTLGHLADQDVDRLRRLHLLAEEELGVEAGFAGLGLADRLARDGDREQGRGGQRHALAFRVGEARLALAVVADQRLALDQAGLAAAGCRAVLEAQLLAVAALGHLRLLLARHGRPRAGRLEPQPLVHGIAAIAGQAQLEGVGARRAGARLAAV